MPTPKHPKLVRMATAITVPAASLPEYIRRHVDMDEEMREAIAAHGGRNVAIFAAPHLELVIMYVEVDDPELWNRSAETEITRAWWRSMADIMPSNADSSPVTMDLPLIFHLA